VIYTIGYQRLTPERLEEIVRGLDATLLDCRFVPMSRKPGFSGKALRARLGERYVAAGEDLGGRGHTTDEGIRMLREGSRDRNVMLLCMEEAPGECHRHFTICGPHFPAAVHIYQDELITAAELERATQEDTDYEISGSLEELLAERSGVAA
jgi:uncharacterized protein (DUF488 family)